MERISDKIAALPDRSNYFSLEFFPPKTQQGFSNLHARLSRMSQALRPLFVNVTWGAGGSTSDKSLALVELTQRQLGLTTCLHLTCTNMSRRLIDETLDYVKSLGVRNILALRGDPPRSEEYRAEDGADPQDDDDDSNKEFTWAVDLVRYIRKKYGDYFCIGIAGYPEGHADQSHPEHQSIDVDLPHLVEKVQAGADFIMTQLFYDVKAFDAYERTLRSHKSGVFESIPIIPGLMPVQSYQILKRTTKLSHAKCPQPILDRFEAVKGDDEAVKRVGVDVISEIVQHLKTHVSSRPKGFHFYTLNLEKAVAQILERCKLIAPSTPPLLAAVDESAVHEEEDDGYLLINNKDQARRRRVSQEANNRVIRDRSRAMSRSSIYEATEDEASAPPGAVQPSRLAVLAISEGEGSLGREATWDDFPNGRWGDARSPAYGEIDGYGVSLHVSIPAALRLWGRPSSTADLTSIFERYVRGEVEAVPWSEEALNEETATIREPLIKLIRKGWWTVASQPAANCIPSTDKIFGWGPKNGFVYQKAFVEMFVPAADWERLQPLLDDEEQLTYFAANAAGHYAASDEEGVNPVTWGAFRGKEIVTPTIIEGMSFKAWAEEAFGIWKEWSVVYKPGSETNKLLRSTREDVWLVNVIHHAYVEPHALWDFLAKA
ncbi:MTHFR-domain-containing protein [Myriangium duriaei CBS 260.36]|uniref:MTHFR-domain-containing protein n=1 Tax=Myriangium duriaei CBS 260.36 TaxID=1168546 RepID=A0A9P4J6Q2_9PEZI|nr:MTHFR-domain-containing protein [Myriangium duriaei CBS 260.36]